MITIISGTNRVDNRTIKVARFYATVLSEWEVPYELFDLRELPADFLMASQYAKPERSKSFYQMQEQYLVPADKFIFILPEYNGSVPGILKLMIDSCDIEEAFYYKKACLTGLSTGRAGNLRGLDHLTNMLHYLKMEIYPDKVPISRIKNELDSDGKWLHKEMEDTLRKQLSGFLKY